MAEAVNLEEMADKLSISLPTMRKLTKLAGFPVVEAGRNGVPWQLDPEAVIAFVRAQREAEAAGRAARSEALAQITLPVEIMRPATAALSAADELKAAQTRRIRMQTDRDARHLVLTTEMRQALGPVWMKLSQSLLAMPAAIGRRHNLPQAVTADIRRQVEQQLRQAHAALVELLPADAPVPPEDDVRAAA